MAAPSTAACFLEWGLYEGLILVVGLLPNAQEAVAAMGITLNTTTITFCISLGFAGAHAKPAASTLNHEPCAALARMHRCLQGEPALCAAGAVPGMVCAEGSKGLLSSCGQLCLFVA